LFLSVVPQVSVSIGSAARRAQEQDGEDSFKILLRQWEQVVVDEVVKHLILELEYNLLT
jgi:hypothetical protein